MKKVIAIVITVFYLCFITGASILAELDMSSYESLIDGRGNESKESETSKSVEIFHIHQLAKSWSRLQAQKIRQNTEADSGPSQGFVNINRQLSYYNTSAIFDYPLFLKNQVFRL